MPFRICEFNESKYFEGIKIIGTIEVMSLQKRKNVRFNPDPGTIAKIDSRSIDVFKPNVSALVQNESYTGCGLVALSDSDIRAGETYLVQVGELAPQPAQIIWKIDVDSEVMKLGLQYVKS